MATPDDIIEAKRIANARAQAQAAAKSVDPFALAAQLAAAPKATGVSQAELDAIAASKLAATAAQAAAKTQATAAAAAVPGATIDPKTGLITPPPKIQVNAPAGKKIKSYQRYVDPISGAEYGIPVYEDGTTETDKNKWVLDYFKKGDGSSSVASVPGSSTQKLATYTATDGKTFTDAQAYVAYQSQLDAQKAQRQSAYDLLYKQFNEYGLGSLVTPLRGLIEESVPPSEFAIRLRQTEPYKKRFAANQARVAKGLRALDEAAYINLEDQYQEVMRQYGLPASYYAKGELGVQPGFEKLIANDVSNLELADRIQTAYNRVINAAPEVTQALKQFYPDITNGDILAYALDPEQALTTLKRKVTAAEIGGAAMAEGLATGLTRAEELQRFGVTGAAYRQAAPFIKQAAERGSELTSFYNQGQFDQTTAEQAALGISGSAEAQKKIRKLSELEAASFSGQAGRAQGALARERAGQF